MVIILLVVSLVFLELTKPNNRCSRFKKFARSKILRAVGSLAEHVAKAEKSAA
jgi:hypothetical protein